MGRGKRELREEEARREDVERKVDAVGRGAEDGTVEEGAFVEEFCWGFLRRVGVYAHDLSRSSGTTLFPVNQFPIPISKPMYVCNPPSS